jgi:hypothetical protein
MFTTATAGRGIPTYFSSDHHPVFTSHRWKAPVHGLGVKEIKTIPYVPVSHPFVERLIGTVRREYLDHLLFWNAPDLERKLADFQQYSNGHRVHSSLKGNFSITSGAGAPTAVQNREGKVGSQK